jgi:valyl-tRNA synthetase
LEEYRFSDATATLYRFFWSEYCDWYVEASKAAFMGSSRRESAPSSSDDPNSESALTSAATALAANKLAVIDFVLGNTLRMFHPFLPFITEELWHGMGFSKEMPADQGGKTIMYAPWPKAFTADEKEYFGLDDAADKVATAKYELVGLGRGLKRECKIDPAKKVKFVLRPGGELPPAELEVLRLLLNAESLDVVDASWQPDKGTPSASNSLGELYMPLAGLVDFAAERARLTKEREKTVAEIGKVEQKLANPNFTEKVPVKVLEEHQQRLADWKTKLAQIDKSLADLPE